MSQCLRQPPTAKNPGHLSRLYSRAIASNILPLETSPSTRLPSRNDGSSLLFSGCKYIRNFGNVTIAFITIKAPVVFLKARNVIPGTENLEDGAYFEHLASESEIRNRIQFDIVDGSPVEIEESDVLCFMLLAHVPDSGKLGGWSMGLILKKTHSGLYFRVGTIDSLAPFQDAEMKVTII